MPIFGFSYKRNHYLLPRKAFASNNRAFFWQRSTLKFTQVKTQKVLFAEATFLRPSTCFLTLNLQQHQYQFCSGSTFSQSGPISLMLHRYCPYKFHIYLYVFSSFIFFVQNNYFVELTHLASLYQENK